MKILLIPNSESIYTIRLCTKNQSFIKKKEKSKVSYIPKN